MTDVVTGSSGGESSDREPTTDIAAPAGRSGRAALAGVVAGGSALAMGELMSGLSNRVPSLVVAVGEFIVDTTPGAIARWSIDQFGSNQKTILVWGITIVSMLFAAGIGVMAWRRAGSRPRLATFVGIAFGLFALLGGLAAARVPVAEPGLAWMSAFVAALTGIAVLVALLSTLYRHSVASVANVSSDTDTTSASGRSAGSRRSFIQLLGGTTIGAAAAALLGNRLRGRFAVEDAREQVQAQIAAAQPTAEPIVESPTASPDPATSSASTNTGSLTGVANLDDQVDGITPLIVPNDEFYRIDAALVVPQVDPADWSLRITGMVDNEIEFTFDDLLARASVEEAVTLSCVSNRVGGDLVGNAVWLGVPLRELLDEAGVQPGATQIVGRSVDNWTGGFPTSHLDDPDVVALVAVGMNGEPLPVIHGFPARLVIAGLYGYVSATKWVEEIRLTTLEDFNGYWITRGWSKEGPIKTQSRIDVPLPRDRRQLEPGIHPIAGVAWAPGRSIAKVEVQIDDGPWHEAELPDELSENAWRQWVYDWEADAGAHLITVRATDGDGDTQTSEITPPAPSGATGWHSIRVEVKDV